jgi:GrpB-like predicted nucleotidyltransferase (UPF0157 family)
MTVSRRTAPPALDHASAREYVKWSDGQMRSKGGTMRPMHVHVRAAGRANQRYAWLCRDFLRAHPTAAEAYAQFKQRLAAVGMTSGVYADIKDPWLT